MKRYILIILVMLTVALNGQTRTYYDEDEKEVDAASATWYSEISKDSLGKTLLSRYSIGDTLQATVQYSDYEKKIRDGVTQGYDKNGNVLSRTHFKNDKRHGKHELFWKENVPRRIETYEHGKLLDGKCFDKNGNEVPYFPSEVRPEYPGGMQKLYDDISGRFKIKKRNKASGRMVLTFIVEKDGSLSNVAVKEGIDPELDKEAIRVMSTLDKFQPGMQEGKLVRVMYSLPITIHKR